MKMVRVMASVSAICAFASVSALADPAPAATEKEIVALTQELMDALVPGKADVWQRLLADDAMVTDEFGRRQNKKEAVDGIHPLPQGFSGKIELRDAHVHVYGDTAVLDAEEYETETVFGQKFVVRYLAMNTYVRRAGEWKVAAMMDVTLPTPPPALDVHGLPLSDYPGTYRYGPERAFIVAVENGKLVFRTKAGRAPVALDAMAKDVFMGGDDEKNILLFRRDNTGKIIELIERRKFNDLHLKRE
jgi:ketosteroid isomerase-like protein